MDTTDREVARAIVNAAAEGHLSPAEARRIADVLDDAAMSMGMEADQAAGYERRRRMNRHASILAAIADQIDGQMETLENRRDAGAEAER